jgi:hypothetical protein
VIVQVLAGRYLRGQFLQPFLVIGVETSLDIVYKKIAVAG